MFTLKINSLLNKYYNEGVSLDTGDVLTLKLKSDTYSKYTIRSIKSVGEDSVYFNVTFDELDGVFVYCLDALVFAKYGFKEAVHG